MHSRHATKGELHGVTVVVDTLGIELFIGRFYEERANGIVLLDVALHNDNLSEISKEEYVQSAVRYGQWKEFDQVVVPREKVRSVSRLIDVDVSAD